MANKTIFASLAGRLIPAATARNRAGAPAYGYEPRHKLAQLAATGTLGQTFYVDAETQLADILAVVREVEPAFVARAAIYARRHGHMKDVPALLVALLSQGASPEAARAFAAAFRGVVDDGRMLRNVVQIMRSGVTGRKSLGTRPKRLVQGWLDAASDRTILRASVGQSPSLADVVKMVHPKPADAGRRALYGWLIGKPYDVAALPAAAAEVEAFRRDNARPVPDVPFQMLTALPLTREHWAAIGFRAGWQMLRMNLNTFARHGAFEVGGFTAHVAGRLRDKEAIRRARVFPYQLMVAHASAGKGVPAPVREALQDAMEVAVSNVPEIAGRVVVCPDVSGSMSSPVTGYRPGASSVVRCIDVAALVAAAVLRANPSARVLPFEHRVVEMDLHPRGSVMTNAAKLAAVGGGGTDCSAPLRLLAAERAQVDLVVFVSDNQSWVDGTGVDRAGTGTMRAWEALRARNPGAKLVCIDLQPYGTTQAAGRPEVLNVGGFSDAVFDVVARFVEGEHGADTWTREIEAIDLA